MKVYNKIVIDIGSGSVIEEDSFEYEGPLALCFNVSKSKTQPTAPTYNESWGRSESKLIDQWAPMYVGRMSQDEQRRGTTALKDYYTNFQPIDRSLATQNQDLARSTLDQTRSANDLQRRVNPFKGDTSVEALQGVRRDTQAGGSVASAFYEQALRGVNPRVRMTEAIADSNAQFAGVPGQIQRSMARRGQSGGASADSMMKFGLEKAKAAGQAAVGARQAAESENFNRLNTAMGARAGTLQQGMSATPYTQGAVSNFGNYGITNPTDVWNAASNRALEGYKAGMGTTYESEQRSRGTGGGGGGGSSYGFGIL